MRRAASGTLRRAPVVLAVLIVAGWLSGCRAPAADLHEMATGPLRVEIEVAGDADAAKFGPRFDRTAVVRSVTVDGIELLGPWGLSDEFGLFGDGVLGYEAAADGGVFLKIGVGRLVRDLPGSYDFGHRYPVETVFPVEVTAGERTLSVSQVSAGAGPWQYSYRKTYRLDGPDSLTIQYELANTGAVAWTFEHYNHHWFRQAGVPVGPDYRVVTGFVLPSAETTFRRGTASLQMPGPLAPGEAAYYAAGLAAVPAEANGFELEVAGVPVVRYRASFAPARFAVYADADGFCPEVFMRAALAPGVSASWSATYRFPGARDPAEAGSSPEQESTSITTNK